MKKTILAASVTAGLSLLAAPAFAQTTGTIGADYARADGSGADTDTYGVSGGVSIPTGGSLTVLLDGSYAHNDDADVDVYGATAHLITRNAGSAWGGYAGGVHLDTNAGNTDVWSVGGEYAKFFSASTLALSLGYAKNDDFDVDATGLTAQYRIFATDNLRFDITGGYARVNTSFGDDDGTELGAGVEYRFNAVPISLGASYSHYDVTGGDSNIFGLSLRYDFGNASLKASDRNGNTFGPLGGLSGFLN